MRVPWKTAPGISAPHGTRSFSCRVGLKKSIKTIWLIHIFVFLVFLIEALLRIVAFGWNEYVASGWNVYDLTVTLAATFGSLLLLIKPSFTVVVILRPLR